MQILQLPTPPISDLPAELQPAVEKHWQSFLSAIEDHDASREKLAAAGGSFWTELTRVWAGSDYTANQCQQDPAMLAELSPHLNSSYDEGHYQRTLLSDLAAVDSEAALHQRLRRFRHREMVRIIWRDLTRKATMEETTRDLSGLAESCIDGALDWLYAWACNKWGTPYSHAAEGSQPAPQRLVVLGMGKLGAHELNLSSDIDLIFAYPAKGETRGGRKSLDNEEFFNRLGQRLIQALDNTTGDGFVFRVDMRLRPYGQSGTLVPNFTAMELYYQDQGRDWERYAMIKARVVGGDRQAGEQLMATLKPFVYRKYLDFSAIESLRAMKEMINREVRRKKLQGNVKLGSGGIREVEFIAQAFQLIRGGRDSRLQQRELCRILPLLPDAVGMPEQAVKELKSAYVFLRNTEHAIQAVADQQTQELPVSELEQRRLAFTMGFDSWPTFLKVLDEHRERVRRHFDDVVAPSQPPAEQRKSQTYWEPLWTGDLKPEIALRLLRKKGFEDSPGALKLITDLRQNRKLEVMHQIGQERLRRVMPRVLEAVADSATPTLTLGRVLQLVEAVLRRSAYLVLLEENPAALKQLVRLCDASPWFAEQLAHQPILLDELIDVTNLYSPPDKAALGDDLRRQLLRIPEEDTEQMMEALRYFKHAHVLRVAAAEVTGALPLMKVSDYLTYIAEVILDQVLKIALRLITEKHGRPLNSVGAPCDPDFIIVGYGKMGGIELSYGSDLDLVFIHDAAPSGHTDGPKPIDNQVFFTRLGQRIITILNTSTASGQLYEVDMRLRPSGASGLLVSSLGAFREYQLKKAWTWEHQALVRARVAAGCPRLRERFEAVRHEVLHQPRDKEKLRHEVREMRQKMQDNLGSKPNGDTHTAVFNLKQDQGGIVAIEFMVQYAVLAFAHQHPELLRYSTNIRLLEVIEQAGLLPPEQANSLREAYKALRSAGHRLALQNRSNQVSGDQLTDHREAVTRIWQQWIDSPE